MLCQLTIRTYDLVFNFCVCQFLCVCCVCVSADIRAYSIEILCHYVSPSLSEASFFLTIGPLLGNINSFVNAVALANQ